MTTFQSSLSPTTAVLHVFEQAGGWQWAITIPRVKGGGFKLIAFSEKTFPVEDAAHTEGSQVLATLINTGAYN